ncbi:MAG: phosphatidate cytidylyltransferase [Bacteroidia bacterium]|nr:phosphatidate cytidylyltransferase [Bacteroidia bacterium]
MKELITRVLTGAVYVVILLAAVFLSSDAFDFLFMIFGLACLYEFKRLVALKGYHIFILYLALWWAFIYFVTDQLAIYILLAVTVLVNIYLIVYLFSPELKIESTLHKFIIGLFYVGGGCIFLTMIPYKENIFSQFLILGIFVMVWVNDSFAYMVGSLFGRNKLFPAVSPKKTIEGSIGGMVFALVAAYILAQYDSLLTLPQWLVLALIVISMGDLGDLVESKLKRQAGVKDSGAILPGHGGMLDRLDSLIFAAPFAFLMLNLITYVS